MTAPLRPAPGTLAPGESHPCADIALRFILSIPADSMAVNREALASCAIEGNRAAEICLETLRRMEDREPVSDRYLMGLAWMLCKLVQGQ